MALNILQAEDMVKGFPDDMLFQQARSPQGQIPQYLVVSEIQRRTDMRKRYQNAQQQPQGTVADQIMAGANPQGQQGIQRLPQVMPQMRPPPQQPPQAPQTPQQAMGGGIMRMAHGGETSPLEAGIAAIPDEGMTLNERLLELVGQRPEVPNMNDIIEARRKDSYNSMLVQLGAGIAAGDMPGGLERAGAISAQGIESARNLEAQSRMMGYKSEVSGLDRDVDILGKAGTIDAQMAQANRPAKLDPKGIEIERLIGLGLPRGMATKLAYEMVTVDPNSATGRIEYIDRVNAALAAMGGSPVSAKESPIAMEVALGGESEPIPEPPAGETLWDLAGAATGLIPGAIGLGSKVLSVGNINPETTAVRAQQIFKNAHGILIRSMLINPRMLGKEIEMLNKELDITPKFLRGEGTLHELQIALDKSLRLRVAQAERDSNDVNLPEDVRKAQAINASAMKNYLAIMGVPQEDDQFSTEAVNTRVDQIKARLIELPK